MNEHITLDLNLEEVNIVLNALGELAAKVSMPVIQKIQEQATPQVTPEPIPAEEKMIKIIISVLLFLLPTTAISAEHFSGLLASIQTMYGADTLKMTVKLLLVQASE